jgi:steroid 5-alpha reductase family enzyme
MLLRRSSLLLARALETHHRPLLTARHHALVTPTRRVFASAHAHHHSLLRSSFTTASRSTGLHRRAALHLLQQQQRPPRRPLLAAASFASSAAAAPPPIMLGWLFRAAGAAGGWIGVDFALQWGGWAVSSLLKTEKYFDLFGTGTFAVVAVGSFLRSALPRATAAAATTALVTARPHFARQALATAMVASWALRLGSFLVRRVHKQGGDSRFDDTKHDPLRFGFIWTMQGLWVAVTVLPVLLLNVAAAPAAAAGAASAAAASALRWTDVAGPALWLAGFATEAVADAQKAAFRADRERNAGRFVDTGLWSLAKFPNYGGEIMAWTGLALLCAGSGAGALGSLGGKIACVASPGFVALLLLKVSGVPIQKEQQQARWGGQPEYEAWRARTNLLLPLPFALPSWFGGPDVADAGQSAAQRRPLADGGDSDKTS